MSSLQEQYHREHEARQIRLGAKPSAKPIDLSRGSEEFRVDMETLKSALAHVQHEIEKLQRTQAVHASLIGSFIASESDDRPHFADILGAVCKFYQVSKSDVLGSQRVATFTHPRQIIFYLSRHLAGLSFVQIGRRVGGRDHSTALHGSEKIARLIKTDEILAREIAALKSEIGQSVIGRKVSVEK